MNVVAKEEMSRLPARNYAYEHGIDKLDAADWKSPHETRKAA